MASNKFSREIDYYSWGEKRLAPTYQNGRAGKIERKIASPSAIEMAHSQKIMVSIEQNDVVEQIVGWTVRLSVWSPLEVAGPATRERYVTWGKIKNSEIAFGNRLKDERTNEILTGKW